jgi:hypothetical protein
VEACVVSWVVDCERVSHGVFDVLVGVGILERGGGLGRVADPSHGYCDQ